MSLEGALGFCPELVELIESGRAIGRTGKVFDSIAALSTVNNLSMIRGLMLELRPERTMEIGLSFGGSCLAFTASHRDLGRPPASQHVALDPFQESVWDATGLAIVGRAGLSGYLDFRPVYSFQGLPTLVNEGARFGLIYVDGSHLFEDVFIDTYYGARLLEDGGVIALDDCTSPHVRKVIAFIRSSLRDSLSEVDVSAFRSDGSAFRYRVAKALRRTQLVAFRSNGHVERRWDSPFHRF